MQLAEEMLQLQTFFARVFADVALQHDLCTTPEVVFAREGLSPHVQTVVRTLLPQLLAPHQADVTPPARFSWIQDRAGR